MSSLFIIIACFLWAFDALIRYPLIQSGIPSITVVFVEHSYLFVILLIFLRKRVKILWHRKTIFPFIIVGSLGSAIATLAFTESFGILNPSLVILLQKLQPLVAIFLARVVLGEKVGRSFLLWAFVSILGAAFIGYEDLYSYFASSEFQSLGFLREGKFAGYIYVAIAIVGWGSATVFGRKLVIMGLKEWDIMLGRFAYGFLALACFSWQTNFFHGIETESLGRIALMVFFSGLLALYFYYRGLRTVPAKRATLLELFFPLCAVFVNWIFLGQTLSLYQWIGGALLVFSSYVLQIKRY